MVTISNNNININNHTRSVAKQIAYDEDDADDEDYVDSEREDVDDEDEEEDEDDAVFIEKNDDEVIEESTGQLPEKSDLARKRKVRERQGGGIRKKTNSSTNGAPKTISLEQRIKEFPHECLEVDITGRL